MSEFVNSSPLPRYYNELVTILLSYIFTISIARLKYLFDKVYCPKVPASDSALRSRVAPQDILQLASKVSNSW